MARMLPFFLLAVLCATPALAQEELNDNRKILEREGSSQTMSEPVYKRLAAIHELMGEGRNADAMKRATTLQNSGGLNGYERALIYQTIGFVFANENKIGQAIEYFEKAIGEEALGPDAQQGMLYSLASLYMAEDKFRKAIETAREWFRYEADPPGDAYMLIGSSFAQLNEYRNALPYVKKAIAKATKPEETWYQLELAIYFEDNQIANAVPLLEKMIQYWPDKAVYWETLYGAHLQLEQDAKALATLMVAYRKGLLTTEDKLLNLVKLNMFLEIPYTAGDMLQQELAAGRITRTRKNLELLQSAWTSAQEYPKALAIMTELGELTGEPSFAIEQAKIYNELADWENVIEAANTALERDYDKPGEAHILIGTAYSELGQLRRSLSAFRAAQDSKSSQIRENARAWIGFVNDRLKIAAPVASNAG